MLFISIAFHLYKLYGDQKKLILFLKCYIVIGMNNHVMAIGIQLLTTLDQAVTRSNLLLWYIRIIQSMSTFQVVEIIISS